MCKNGVLPTPLGQFFQIHGSKFEPDPSSDCGQASVMCITHRVFLFRICKDTFDGLFPLGVDRLAQVGLSDALYDIQVSLPDVGREYLLPFLICLTVRSGWAADTVFWGATVGPFSFPVCCGMAKFLAAGAGEHIFCGVIFGSPRDGILLCCLYISYMEGRGSFHHLKSFWRSMGSYILHP